MRFESYVFEMCVHSGERRWLGGVCGERDFEVWMKLIYV